MIGSLENNNPINTLKYPFNCIPGMLDLYVKLGWCEESSSYLTTCENLSYAISAVEDDLEHVMSTLINSSEWTRRFLLVHSQFFTGKQDWFQKLMTKLVQPTEDDIDWIMSTPHVPSFIMSKFKAFEPEPVLFEKERIRITYKMYGKRDRGEQMDPIEITDIDWERIEKEALENKVDPSKFESIAFAPSKVLDLSF